MASSNHVARGECRVFTCRLPRAGFVPQGDPTASRGHLWSGAAACIGHLGRRPDSAVAGRRPTVPYTGVHGDRSSGGTETVSLSRSAEPVSRVATEWPVSAISAAGFPVFSGVIWTGVFLGFFGCCPGICRFFLQWCRSVYHLEARRLSGERRRSD